MDLTTLVKKRIENGVVIMTEPTVLFSNNTQVISKFKVDSHFAGRPDLISINVYGTASFADYILKYNNISNPFSIAEGDTLLIPQQDATLLQWNNKPSQKSSEQNIIRQKFIDTKRLSVQDQKRIDYLKRKAAAYSNGATEILPPNVLKTGKTNITISNGVITVNGPSTK
jgi:hypothetical protein